MKWSFETTEGKTENYELIKFLRSNARYLHQPASRLSMWARP